MNSTTHNLIADVNQVTPIWLAEVLREGGHLPQGQVVDVQPNSSPPPASPIAPLEVRYSKDAPKSASSRLILKISKRMLTSESPKDIEFYQSIAVSCQILWDTERISGAARLHQRQNSTRGIESQSTEAGRVDGGR